MRCFISLFLLSLLLSSASEWTAEADLDSSFEKLVAADNRIVAYSQDKTASSSDGVNWSETATPGFPILDITPGKSGGFLALGYELDPHSSQPEAPKYALVLKESVDGLEWVDWRPGGIIYIDGFDLPVRGEIVESENHFLLTITMEALGLRRTQTFLGNDQIIEETPSFYWPSNLASFDGKYFFKNSPPWLVPVTWCPETLVLNMTTEDLLDFPTPLNKPINFQTMSGDLLMGQNGVVREGGETYFGNWGDLGIMQGHENGIGLVIPTDATGSSVYVSTDHLVTWQEETLPGSSATRTPIVGEFFNGQWLVLADTGSNTTIYSHPAPEVTYSRVGEVELGIRQLSDANLEIITCREKEVIDHAVEITFPDQPGSHYRLYTSRDLVTWVRYGLQFPTGSTHRFPLGPELRSSKQIYFKAEEVIKNP